MKALISHYSQILRFLFSGGLAFLSNIIVLYVLTDLFDIYYLVSSGFAFVAAFVVSFTMQKFWTFKNKEIDRISSQVGMSLLVAVSNLGVNIFLMYGFVDIIGFHYLFAQVCTAGLIAIESYFAYKYLIFKTVTTPSVSI